MLRGGAAFVVLPTMLATACACGDDTAPARVDAGFDGGGDAGFEPIEPEPPLPPEAPAPPDWECPAGWRAVPDPDAVDVVACEPWPESGRPDCVDDSEAVFPGQSACALVGTPCPAGDFAEDLPAAGDVVHVRAGDPPGGDGSAAAPFATIADGLAAASDGAVVALSKGSFDEVVALDRPVTLWGACVAATSIAPAADSDIDPVVAVSGADVEIRNLTLTGRHPGIEIRAAADATMDAVVVRDVWSYGVQVTGGGRLGATDLVVRRVDPDSRGADGRGVVVTLGGVMVASRLSVSEATASGIRVVDPWSSFEGTDVVVARARVPVAGLGVSVLLGAAVTLHRTVVEETAVAGINVHGDGTVLTATDLVVRDTRANSEGAFGNGLVVQELASASVGPALVERNAVVGVNALRATLVLTDAIVRDSLAQPSDGFYGVGLDLASATARIERIWLGRNRSVGLHAIGGTIDAVDLVVAGTLPTEADQGLGIGLEMGDGAAVTVLRAVFDANRTIGVSAYGPGTSLTCDDVAIRGTLPTLVLGGRDGAGVGMQIWQAAIATLRRVEVSGNRTMGVAVLDPGSRYEGTDVAVTDTLSRLLDGDYGYGIQVGAGASLDLERVQVRSSRRAGVLIGGTGSAGTLRDLAVLSTLERDCVLTTCKGEGGGTGLAALEGATLEATRIRVSDSALCGVQLAREAQMDLHQGRISENPVGANVQIADYDLSRLRDGVVFSDNGRDLDAEALPLPEPAERVSP